MKIPAKQFDIHQRLPNVLLVGNGPLLSLASLNGKQGETWSQKLLRLAEESHRQQLSEFSKQIPYALLATLVAAPEDDARHTQYARAFPTLCCADTTLLYNLVNAGFDAVLTTNYTYEIENCFKPDYSALKNKAAYAFEVERQGDTTGDAKYLLHTYNQLADGPPIWHIHGEARRKSSIILTHDEYARLIHKLVEENKRNRNKFVEFETEVRYSSWLDYFLVSNLYIVGWGWIFPSLTSGGS